MNATVGKPTAAQAGMTEALRAEAAIEPDAPADAPVTKQTQIIAIYGKGGIGKSPSRSPTCPT